MLGKVGLGAAAGILIYLTLVAGAVYLIVSVAHCAWE